MSVNASCQSVCQERTVSSLLAGRVVKRQKVDDGQQLQASAIRLLQQHQHVSGLLQEVENLQQSSSGQSREQRSVASESLPSVSAGSLLAGELKNRAEQLGVPVTVVSAKMMMERLMKIVTATEDEDGERQMLTPTQRLQLCVLLESSRDLKSQGIICVDLLWQEYKREQKLPSLEILYHLHMFDLLSVNSVLLSDEGVRQWLVSQLQSLCCWTPPQTEDQTRVIQYQVLSMLMGVLLDTGFDQSREKSAAEKQGSTQVSTVCCYILDHMLFWILDHVDSESPGHGPELWMQTFDRWVGGAASVSTDALQRFFTHSLTQILTYRPGLTVSDAVSQQNQWTFAKSSCLLTSLFRQMSVTLSSQQLLRHLHQVLETHEVNWKHVLSFLSTLLVYDPGAQSSLRELLSTLLTSAFEGYDLEHMITAFLLARQGALEGTAIFSSYTEWFKMSFGGSSCHHATRKKSLVFLLKFLSDLVPFEPSNYLKVHILHPPFTPVKHRSLLMEYISLAKTRLNDLKESLEDMGLYQDVSTAVRTSAEPQCPAVQDVERAVSLFETTGKISATVMEASIFRRPYFLTRFLPALLIPRVLPAKADARMSLIEALKKADKIPVAQFSSYVEACQRQRQQDRASVCLDTSDSPVELLRIQLQEFRGLVVGGADGDLMAQLSRMSHTLGTIFPAGPDDVTEPLVITVGLDSPPSPELHVTVVNMILTNFCQCLLDACRANPPNKQSLWASRLVSMLVSNRLLASGLIRRLWDLFNNQGPSLSPAHLLGLAALVVHLHTSMSDGPLVQLQPPAAVPVGDALGSALMCRNSSDMIFTARLCVAAVSYGMCRGNSQQHQHPEHPQQDEVPSSFYKKLFYLIPRLLPVVRRSTLASGDAAVDEISEVDLPDLWSSVTDSNSSWRKTALRLWMNSEFQLRLSSQQSQLSLTEWLHHELGVQRSEDALSDPQRQEYQQWACLEFYCPRSEDQGGCGGDMEILCSHLLDAVMNQPSSDPLLQRLDPRASSLRGTCLPDIMSRLQEFFCEFNLTNSQSHRSSRADVCDFLFDFISRRFSSTGSSELHLQHTLNTWNRVLLSLPPLLLVKVRSEGGRKTLDCSRMIQHINQHQRISCSDVGFLSFRLTAHFVRALFCASFCCERRGEEVNKSWSQISEHCPLLLTSAVLWWRPLSAMLSSLWKSVGDEEPLSEKLQLITDCQHWANSVVTSSWSGSMPSAPPLLLASCLYQSSRCPGQNRQRFISVLNLLRPERGAQYRQVLVFLFFLCVNRFLSLMLYAEQKNKENILLLCSELLSVLVDSSDWLLVFTPGAERGIYQLFSLMTSDDLSRMMPWGFYMLLLQQKTELQQRLLRCPGYVHTCVHSYICLLQLFLDGQTPTDPETEEQQILTQAKMFVLRVISQAPPAALSSAQIRRLEAQCTDLDPEVTAALSLHLEPPDLSPEMDFL